MFVWSIVYLFWFIGFAIIYCSLLFYQNLSYSVVFLTIDTMRINYRFKVQMTSVSLIFLQIYTSPMSYILIYEKCFHIVGSCTCSSCRLSFSQRRSLHSDLKTLFPLLDYCIYHVSEDLIGFLSHTDKKEV